jgi:hypothetical protein
LVESRQGIAVASHQVNRVVDPGDSASPLHLHHALLKDAPSVQASAEHDLNHEGQDREARGAAKLPKLIVVGLSPVSRSKESQFLRTWHELSAWRNLVTSTLSSL